MKKTTKSILVILYYLFFNVMIYIPFALFDINISTIPENLFNFYYIATETIFFITLFYIYRKDFTYYIDDFKKNGENHLRIGFKYWLIGLAIMIISNIIISTLSPLALPENEQAIRESLKVSPLFIAFSSVISAPIIEEILFRKTLFDIFKNKKIFVVVSGLIFGSFHIIGVATTLASWLYVIPYAALGMAFAYSYVKTKNLLTPMCLHAFHNLVTVIQILLLM
jgi:membrane protease YdiL (CAAX protease family)